MVLQCVGVIPDKKTLNKVGNDNACGGTLILAPYQCELCFCRTKRYAVSRDIQAMLEKYSKDVIGLIYSKLKINQTFFILSRFLEN